MNVRGTRLDERYVYRALFCGDRNWANVSMIEAVMLGLRHWAEQREALLVVINGMAPGADIIANETAIKHDIDREEYPADWLRFKKAAGPIRNKQMLDDGRPKVVFAFHNDLENSKGTKDCLNQALSMGIKCFLISEYS